MLCLLVLIDLVHHQSCSESNTLKIVIMLSSKPQEPPISQVVNDLIVLIHQNPKKKMYPKNLVLQQNQAKINGTPVPRCFYLQTLVAT
ncbi:hypothetical protein EB796_000649 [Bugula neritina]|uniref:Uncharacterized protein n=1 Tax=Bugula neritina TaxID=10212 RepID=A0A7J7KSC5_BUGNE|nr:hypothetical protein EB796_000649 [Bugula neritina]